MKNLLAGVTTVAHHNPFYPEMRRTMPVRVVRRYGWAHSFLLERQPAGARGEPGGDVARRWQATPADAPFVLHLAEGVDEEARAELPRLEALGCLKPNTVIVHGVAIDGDGWRRVAHAGAGLVWCPGVQRLSLRPQRAGARLLLDEPIAQRRHGGRRSTSTSPSAPTPAITGSRDLLDELRAARDAAPVSASRAPAHGDDQRRGAAPPAEVGRISPLARRPISSSSRRSNRIQPPRC